MTVNDLIRLLQAYEPETRLLVPGYENGADELLLIIPVKCTENGTRSWYRGRYTIERIEELPKDETEMAILLIGRHDPDGLYVEE